MGVIQVTGERTAPSPTETACLSESVGCNESALQSLEGLAFCFGICEEHGNELDRRHDGEKDERRRSAHGVDNDGKRLGDGRVHKPMAGRADTLPLRANRRRKYFADVDPDHCALGKRETCYVADK